MTAEGDNRVLMQKVAKEYTSAAGNSPKVAERLAAAARGLSLPAGAFASA